MRFAKLKRDFNARIAPRAASAAPTTEPDARTTPSPLPVVCGHGPWPLGSSGGREERGRSWFGSRIPGAEAAEDFFRRRGGPASAWKNSASQRGGMPDWDAAVPYLCVPTLLVAARDDVTTPYGDTEELLEALPEATTRSMHTVEEGGHFGIFDTPLHEPSAPHAPPAPHPTEVRLAARAIAEFVACRLKCAT